jgi:predicted O-linked N-acetylglucosamine transferase (SPINDLY family)
MTPPDPNLASRQARALALQAEGLRRSGHAAEAEAAYRQALALDPRDAESHYGLGLIAQAGRRHPEAIDAFLRAITVDGGVAAYHARLGEALLAEADTNAAIVAFQKALSLRPDDPALLLSLGGAYVKQGRLTEAVALFEQARNRDPTNGAASTALGNACMAQGAVEAAIPHFERALKLDGRNPAAESNLLFCLIYSERPPAEIAERHRAWGAREAARVRPATAHPNDRDPDRRLRIGYVSGDFKGHAVSYFLAPLLAAHDHDAVEVCCYSEFDRRDAVTERFMALADRWRDTPGQSDAAVAEMIAADQIDILVDLAGHTAGHRLGVFARKPAPVQVSWLGYPATTGLPTLDYRLVDAVTDPPGPADALATETLIRLEDGFLCYEPAPDAPDPGPPPGLANGFVTFGSFNNQTKLSPTALKTWARLLKAVPTARLLFKGGFVIDPGARERVSAAFEAEGVAPDRLILHGFTGTPAEHLAVYNQIDMALDPFPYNGTTTTCETLWMGVPVVTLAGQAHAGRVGASLLSLVGLEDLIAEDLDGYIRIATALAADPDRLTDLRRTLRPRMAASPLCDAPAFARKMEAAYRALWQRWAGEQS